MAQPQAKESVTRIDGKKQTLVLENLTYGEALGTVTSMRAYIAKLKPTHPELKDVYYRLGRPH